MKCKVSSGYTDFADKSADVWNKGICYINPHLNNPKAKNMDSLSTHQQMHLSQDLSHPCSF